MRVQNATKYTIEYTKFNVCQHSTHFLSPMLNGEFAVEDKLGLLSPTSISESDSSLIPSRSISGANCKLLLLENKYYN